MKRTRTQLTKPKVESFHKEAGTNAEIWDDQLSGFHIRKYANHTAFRLFYRNQEGRRRFYLLGRYPDISTALARSLAKDAIASITKGEDIQQAKQEIKHHGEQRANRALGQFIGDGGLYRAYQGRKKAGEHTLKMLIQHFSCWAGRPMDEITPKDAAQWQNQKESDGLAFATIQRTFGALKTCINYAVEKQVIEQHQLERFKLEKPHLSEDELAVSGSSRTFLTEDEIQKVFKGLDAYQEQKRQQRRNSREHGKSHLQDLDTVPYADHVAPWILTMLYTGFRPGDIYGLRWEHTNLPFRTITKTIEKTAHHQPEARSFPISTALVDVLTQWHTQQGRPAKGYVFPTSHSESGRMNKRSMLKPWDKVRALGDLRSDLTLYSLRHNFASQLIHTGADLLTVSRLMAHTDIQTTVKHYGHLKPDLARDYVDRFANSLTPKIDSQLEPQSVSPVTNNA